MNKVISTKTQVFISLAGPSGTGKSQLFDNWLKSGNIQTTKTGKKYLLYQHSQLLYDVLQKGLKISSLFKVQNFIFIGSLKINGTKNLLTSEDSCEEVCKSKAFVDFATAGELRGLRTLYIKYNLLHQSKLGRKFELRNTHIVLLKCTCDVLHNSTLSAQLDLGSQLIDWFDDATSVPYGHLLIDLSPQTDDRLPYRSNTGSIHSKFVSQTDWGNQKCWTMNLQNLSTLQVLKSFSHKPKTLFLQSSPKEFIRAQKTAVI